MEDARKLIADLGGCETNEQKLEKAKSLFATLY